MSAGLPDNTETELKLRVRPEDLGRLRDAAILGGEPGNAGKGRARAAKGKVAARILESTYYDTPDLRLGRQLVTLRVRRQGDGFIQTIKAANDPADGLGRSEWEWTVDGPEPDLARIDDPAARKPLDGITVAELRPLFASHIERLVRVVRRPGGDEAALVEVAFDTGEIRSGDKTVPVSEIELELKDGGPAALFDLALEVSELAPVRVEFRTKAARGYALASGQADGAVKAPRLELDGETTVEEAMLRIMRSCVGHMMANEACALDGRDPEGIHQMRVALRRLRSALSVFRPLIPTDQYEWLVGEVKWLAGAMGPARDWDVFMADLLAPVQAAFDGDPLLGADMAVLGRAAQDSRERGYVTAREAILSPRYTTLLLRIGAWLEGRGWRDQPVSEQSAQLFRPVVGLADRLLAKRHKRARKTGSGFAELSTTERHELRIALKKLRYAAEFFRSLYDEKAAKRYVAELAALQDALGHLNDVATATQLLSRLHEDGHGSGDPEGQAAERRASGLVIGWHGRGMTEVEPVLRKDWEGFTDAKPFWSKPA